MPPDKPDPLEPNPLAEQVAALAERLTQLEERIEKMAAVIAANLNQSV